MARRLTLTQLNGVDLSTLAFSMDWESGQTGAFGINLTLRTRASNTPDVDGYDTAPRDMGFVCWSDDPDQTLDAFRSAVSKYIRTNGQPLTVTALKDPSDNTSAVQNIGYVTARKFDSTIRKATGTIRFIDPAWQTVATTSDSTSPTTNAGQLEAYPSIALTGGAVAVRNRGTVTDRTGYGIGAYPIRFDYGAGHDPANLIVYLNGRSVPFWYDTTSGTLWVRVDCKPLASAFVDIYRSDAINNTVTAQALDMGGLAVTSSNTVPAWDNWQLEQHPDSASLVWKPQGFPNFNTTASSLKWTYQIYKQEAGGATFEVALNAAIDLRNDYNGLVAVLPVQAASGATLTATFDYVFGQASDTVVLPNGLIIQLLTRKRDEYTWSLAGVASQPAVSHSSGDTGITLTADVSDAVEIGLVVETGIANVPTGATATALIKVTGMALSGINAAQVPNVALSADIAARYVSGALVNTTTGDQITFTDLLFDDVTFTIDHTAASPFAVDSGPWYEADIAMTNPGQWWTLAEGDNDWTAPAGTSVTLTWADREEF